MACRTRETGARMITPERVGQDTYQAVEGSLRLQLHKLRQYDWWQAGIQSGTVPSEWETLKYGRERALAHYLDGLTVSEAVNQGVKAMYQLAYGDIRDSIRRRGNITYSATSTTEIVVAHVDQTEFDMLEAVASSPLSDVQKRMVARFMYGDTVAEASRCEGLSVRTGGRRFEAALNVLKEIV